MTLTTHAIVAGAVGAPLLLAGHPVLALMAGVGSHYLIDTIPHWSYRLKTLEGENVETRRFNNGKGMMAFDLMKIFADFAIGLLTLSFLASFTNVPTLHLVIIGFAGMLPDALQGIQVFMWKGEPVRSFQKFHDIFHFKSPYKNHDLPLTIWTALAQLSIVTLAVWTALQL